jgi:hypothetical protein
MKKIIALFVFMLAFGLTANAQQKGSAENANTAAEQQIKQAAAKDVALMMEVIELDSQDKQNFMGLFERKHRYLMQNLSEERKTILRNETKAKIEATLDADQNAKLAQSPEVLQKLIN